MSDTKESQTSPALNANKGLIVIHDYFQSAEGGGRLSLSIVHRLNASLCYGFKVEDHPFFSEGFVANHDVNLNVRARIKVIKQLLLIRAFQKKTSFLSDYETVIYSGFYSLCAVENHRNRKNIYYCHTPPRFMYDKKREFKKRAGLLGRIGLDIFINYYKPIYENAISKMDLVLTNSNNVKDRIHCYLGIESSVVYPPCKLNHFKYLGQDDYYLSVARHDYLKRVDLIIKAFKKTPDKNLIVISGGPQESELKRLADGSDNIRIFGWVSENRMIELLGNCIATIYIPEDEDFGMSPVESMASGKPVIGTYEGGIKETVIDGVTGVLIPPKPTIYNLIDAVDRLTPKIAYQMKTDCIKRASFFSEEEFLSRIQDIITN